MHHLIPFTGIFSINCDKVNKEKGNQHDNQEKFLIVSVDNIDFMHSYARVFQGNQTSSWHGTTVQAAQPKPSLSLLESDNEMMHMSQTKSSRHGLPLHDLDTVPDRGI